MEQESVTGKRKSEELVDDSNPKAIKSENPSTTSDFFSNIVKDVTSVVPSFSSSAPESIQRSSIAEKEPSSISSFAQSYPSIDYNGYRFQLWYKAIFSEFKDREMVRIRSITLENPSIFKDFFCYRSQSELGIWRLTSQALPLPGDPNYASRFDKFQYPASITYPDGTRLSEEELRKKEYYYYGDYVQTSVIFIPLQCFINANIGSIPILDETDNPNIFADYESAHSGNVQIVTDVSVNNKKHKNPSPLSIVNNEPDTRIQLSHSYQEPKNINSNPVITEYPAPPQEILSRERQQSYPFFENLNRKFNTITKFNDKKLAEFKNYMATFEMNFDYENVETLCDWKFKFENCIEFNGVMKKIQIKNKHDRNIFYIYCVEGHLCPLGSSSKFTSNIQQVCQINIVYAPVTLVPQDGDTCNIYGLYSKYVSAGRLIGKLFDYNINVQLSNPLQCSKNYSFAGMNYGELFPFNKINPEMLTQPEEEATQPLDEIATQPLDEIATIPEDIKPLNKTIPLDEPPTEAFKGGKRRKSRKKTKRHTRHRRNSKKKINKYNSRRRTLKRHRRKLHRSHRR
jgi:hypothetical protein